MKIKCNHKNKMFPVYDKNKWNVGMMCDCGYFEAREGIPNYERRQRWKDE